MEQTKTVYFTLLYTGTTSTDQHTVSNLVGFLAVSRVNKSASTSFLLLKNAHSSVNDLKVVVQ